MYPTHPVAPAICIAALACGACAAHVIPVPSPAFAPSAHALPGSVPVAIAIELMNPDIIGEHRDGTMDVHQYDYTSPVLRAGVEEHIAAAAQVFGLQAAPSASLRLEGQVDLSDGDGVIFARAMLGRAALSDREDPTAAFLALDEALLDWFQALDARIRSSPAVARRLRGR